MAQIFLNNFWFYCLSVLISIACISADLPADIQKCQAEDVTCISNVMNDIIHKNPKGRSDLGLPNLDPYTLKKLVISDARQGSSLNLDLAFNDVKVSGLPQVAVEKLFGFSKDPTTSKFEIHANIPKLELVGKYKASGRILILPIEGEGNSKVVLTNVKASVKFKPTISNENGKLYITDSKVKSLLEPSKMEIYLENLFNGNKELGDNMNVFLNENWKDVWTELAPNINAALSDIVRDILNGIFKKVTYDEFYL